MNGYVKNISSEWSYAMKRSVRPGGEIPLDELYEQYGKKYDMEPDEDFIKWLTNVKLKNTDRWKVVFSLDGHEPIDTDTKKAEIKDNSNVTTPLVSKGMKVEDVVNLTVRKARTILPKITDLNLLRYSLQEANQMAGKDSLTRMLRKRIKELQIAR